MDDTANYAMPANSWPSQVDMSNPSYGSPIVAPMYSDERTALSGDYPPNTQFHPAQNFHPQQLPPGHPASCNYYLLIIPVLVFSIYADPKPCSMLKELLFV
jgi:lysine-specific demethylase 3